MLKLRLSRDLRKNILRGHPWVYRAALEKSSYKGPACLSELLDKKGQSLAWGFYSAQSPLAFRVLSLARKPPNEAFFAKKMAFALSSRQHLRSGQNNAFRLINGEGDGLPGFVCDVYNDLAVIQFDGQASFEFWDQDWLAEQLLEISFIKSVYYKPRFSDSNDPQSWGETVEQETCEIVENSVHFFVNFKKGQKTGFFMDQRDNRKYLRSLSADKSVLNLFSYTGGFSVYAGLGGANQVTSVDMAPEAIALANQNWKKNQLSEEKHQGVVADVFHFVKENQKDYDMVIVDPPSMTHSEKTKLSAMKSYTDLFQQAARMVTSGGDLVLSSCSSHISFNDFLEIIDESLSAARLTGKILRVSGQGEDHPFPHFCREMRYLKFVHIKLN